MKKNDKKKSNVTKKPEVNAWEYRAMKDRCMDAFVKGSYEAAYVYTRSLREKGLDDIADLLDSKIKVTGEQARIRYLEKKTKNKQEGR